ncbi:hypothetical protein L210DRAFT_3505436 [Boletus edulis BED1]|uniref:CxC2-like cysteine cluster KDZ transposase-associated domain-containing protein n=1 Tax=Boletus edulis BED1 TaxID=1328754 RepID=A0AAD4GDM3_BOLED|nr:hypothetical protein L210DRAFT_3505436 [Boletus edulis BED1]
MPTNHNKRRINPGKVTRVAWITKDMARGPKGQMVRLEGQTAKLSTDLGHSSPVKSFGSPTSPTKPMNLSSSPIKPIGLAAKFSDQQYQDLDDSYVDLSDIRPLRWPVKKTSNSYLLEWLSRKTEFLDALLDMEAPPKPRQCSSCHLSQAGFEVHLGHEGKSCPSRAPNKPDLNELPGSGPDEWIDTDEEYIPSNLRAPNHEDYLTIVDTTGIHYLTINYCRCPDSPPAYMQLFRNKLFPATLDQPWTAFTFHVLDDFIRDNLECGTSGSNYFSKLRCITSNIFPHLVPNRYRELLRVSRIWRLLKLLKWKGFGHRNRKPKQGELALFCPSCPQPGINCNPTDEEVSSWKYTRTLVMDGNFKAEHMHDKRPEDQIWLMDGLAYMVGRSEYQSYLKATHHPLERSTCNNHRAVNQANKSRGKLESTGVGGTACARHGCFVPHTLVDFQKGEWYTVSRTNLNFLQTSDQAGIGIWHVHGHQTECFARHGPLFIQGAGWVDGEIIKTLWSMLNIVSPSARGMSSPHRQELLDFQMNDSNFMKMIRMSQSLVRKYRKAVRASASASAAFNDLDGTVNDEQRQKWVTQELHAQKNRISNPSAMDIFDMQLQKAPTMQVVELDLLRSVAGGDSFDKSRGRNTTWLSRGLKLEEGQIAFARERRKMGGGQCNEQLALARRADQLCGDISAFLTEARAYFGNGDTDICLSDDGGEGEAVEESADEEEVAEEGIDRERPDQVILPLPSNLGLQRCQGLKMNHLVELELKLRIGQANDALHEIGLPWRIKTGYFKHKFGMPTIMIALQNLGADNETLQKYKVLEDADLKMKATASGGNKDARSSRNDHLSWFWSLDVLRDTDRNDWMSEFYRVHWLRSKAVKDRWQEEVELLRAEFEWATNFFQRTAEDWEHRSVRCQNKRLEGQACYAARQSAIYGRLRDQCKVAWEKLNADQTRACSPLEGEVGLVLVKDLTKGEHCLAQSAFHPASRWLVGPGVPESRGMAKFSQAEPKLHSQRSKPSQILGVFQTGSKQHERKIRMVLCYGALRLEAAAVFLRDCPPAEWPNDWHANWTLDINRYLYTQGLYSVLRPDKPPLRPSCMDKLLQLGPPAERMRGLLREQGWEVDPFGTLRRILPNWQPISPRQPFGLPDPWWYENIPKSEYKQCRRRLLPYIDQVAEEALVFFRGMWTFDEPLPDEAASVKGLSDGLKDFTDELARNYSELQKVNRAMEEAWFVGLKTAGRQ